MSSLNSISGPSGAPATAAVDSRWNEKARWKWFWLALLALSLPMLIVYLANELGAKKIALGVALILAAPKFLGVLRLSAPALIDRLADRKRFCIISYAISACLLLPVATRRCWIPSKRRMMCSSRPLKESVI